MEIYIFLVGCVWVTFGVIMKTKNLASSLLFKVFPILTGGFVMYYAANILEFI